TAAGLDLLKTEMAKTQGDPVWHGLLTDTYDYYRQASAFHPRGFREKTEYGDEPLLPAQRFGIWEALQSLTDPKFESAVHMSEARIGKTIMSILSAYNIQGPKTGAYAVRRVLYTTTNQAKYEVANELSRRTDLDLQVVVIDSEKENGDREEQIQEAIELAKDGTKNVVVIANYESVQDFPQILADFAPDAHIIDEVENLKEGEDTQRAPVIFGIPAKYRIGISARPVINSKDDIIELLLWARHHTYLLPGQDAQQARKVLEGQNAGELFEAMDPVKVRWRRKVVMPEVKDPIEQTEHIVYSPHQEEVIAHIRGKDFVVWKQTQTRPDQARDRDTDHIFVRYQMERRASIELGLVLPEAVPGEFMDPSPKIQRLDEIIAREIKSNGKVVVLVDFIEEIEKLMARYNDAGRYGEGAAVGIFSKVSMQERLDRIWRFRSQPKPLILIGTPGTIGSSLNLFQIPGSPFHISTMVRLSRPWKNFDDGARLVGIGQDHQVKVITLVSAGTMQTIDEKIELVLADKREIFKHVVDGKPIIDDEAKRMLETIAGDIIAGKSPAQPSANVGPDQAMTTRGGIDLDRAKMQMNVRKDPSTGSGQGAGSQIQFDRAMIGRIKRDGFDGLEFKIETIVPVINLPILLGLRKEEMEGHPQLAGTT
ncbi:MAG TPA: SNF2-related protein, partial [Candidatus Omnitrophota bacterium]|nr:SNF2-related protein [Candidatus Omnitrophota bacterium]